MELTDIKNELIEVIAELFKLNKSEIDAQILDNGEFYKQNINSMTFIRLVVEIEKKYKIEFEDAELAHTIFSSLDNLAEIIYKKLNI